LSFNLCRRVVLGWRVLSGVSWWTRGGHRAIIFGFLPQNLKTRAAVAVAFIMAWGGAGVQDEVAAGLLVGFRDAVHTCFARRADALSELADAVLCSPGRVTDLARLSLAPEFRRGHGALYDALGAGEVEFARLRAAVEGLPLPTWRDGRIRLAVDVSGWLRPDARASPGRMFCHVPGWPYSHVAALGPGASSWAVLLDAVRIGPDDDATDLNRRPAAGGRGTADRDRAAPARQPGHHRRDGRRLRPGPAGVAAAGPAGDRVRPAAGRAGPAGPGPAPRPVGPRPAAGAHRVPAARIVAGCL
jgi:hypothetical protein